MKRTTARGFAVLGAAMLVAIALAACGGGGGSSSTSTTSSKAPATNSAAKQSPTGATGGSALARRTALAACLKKYGVTLPSFGGGRFRFGATGATGRPGGFSGGAGGFANNPKLTKALQKCGGSAGFGGLGRFGATGRTGASNFSTSIRTELTSFDACMKKHGETLPAPNLSGTGSVFGNVNQTTASFKAAYAPCKGILTYLNHPRGPTGASGPATG